MISVAIVAALILLNALFVAAEFAIVSVSRMDVERARRDGRTGARLLHWFVSDPIRQDRFIATAQLGITAASLGLGMYGEHQLAVWIAAQLEGWGAERWIAAHTVASVTAVAILTYFHIVLGEMIPKALALQQPADVSLAVAYPMRALQLAAYPIVVGFNGIGNLLLRLVGVRRSEGGLDRYRTPEEIAYIVRESAAGGALRKQSARVVSELLDFANLTAAEVMVPRVRIVGLPIGVDRARLRTLLTEQPHTRYPVYDGSIDNIVGMLHIRDVVRWAPEKERLEAQDIRRVPHVPATSTTEAVLEAMRRTGVQMVVVMGEHGGTHGIITLEDLFEEIVGDISEDRGGEPSLTKTEEGHVHADGAVRLDELGEALGVVLEHEEVDTVSGLVLALLGRPPELGDTVHFDGVEIRVTKTLGHGVAACEAWLAPENPAQAD